MPSVSNNNCIIQHHNSPHHKSYYVGYVNNQYDWDRLLDLMMDSLVDFVYGFHKSALNPEDATYTLKKALQKLSNTEERLKNTGEVGELLLHIILRKFFHTTPLLQKMYLKTNRNDPVKGIDIVHAIEQDNNLNIIFGEAKLYKNPSQAIADLLEDVKSHYNNDFMTDEFITIGDNPVETNLLSQDLGDKYKALYSKLDLISRTFLEQPNVPHKINEFFNGVSIVLFCAFKSDVFEKYKDMTDEFVTEMENKLNKLFEQYDKVKPTSNGDIIFVLFPLLDHDILINKFLTKLREADNGQL